MSLETVLIPVLNFGHYSACFLRTITRMGPSQRKPKTSLKAVVQAYGENSTIHGELGFVEKKRELSLLWDEIYTMSRFPIHACSLVFKAWGGSRYYRYVNELLQG